MYLFFSITAAINAILSLLLGLIVFVKNKKNSINIYFALFCLSAAAWSIPYVMWPLATTADDTLFWFRVLHLGSIFLSVTYLHFVSIWLGKYDKTKYIVLFGYLLSFFFVSRLFSPSFISSVEPKSVIKFWGNPGYLYHYYLVYFFSYALYSFYLLLSSYKDADDIKKSQIKFILFGVVISYLGGSTNYFLWYNIPILPYGNVFASVYVVLTGYAIVAHHLMDVRLVMRKYLVYTAYAITIALIFLVFKLITYTFVSTTFAQIIDLVLLITAVLFTNPLKRYYYKIANQHFFSSLYDTEDVIEEISNQLHSTIDLQKICEAIYGTLKKNFHLQSMGILRLKNRNSNFHPLYNHNLQLPKNVLPNNTFLYDHFLSYNITVTTAQLKELNETKLYPIIEVLEELKIAVLVPLIIKNDVIGILALGNKESKDVYNEEDLRVLKIIAAQGATAIENARLYAEVQSFGTTLQKKVDEQTREIKAKAEHLKKLMDMRSEFLDITSHQLRTPVSVIKGVLSMLEEGSIPEDRKQAFIKGAMEKSIKLGEIINDILRASEMDSDKFTMTIREVDLNDMMNKIKDDKIRSAEIKKLKLFMDIPTLPPVMTDPKYVEHAIVNLINNSIQYTVQGSITVTAEISPTHVIIRVADTGIGIPIEAREKLFTKFARAANAVTTFTDGTGLGLFIIKQIVDANPGAKIEVEKTEINKGTTFAYWLPRADVK